MSHHFHAYTQDQLFLMPPSVREWVREDSVARFVSEVVDGLEEAGRLSGFYARYREDGRGAAAYHPVMMVKVLVYAYSLGMSSSRKIAEALERDVTFRYLAANQQPDFRTICLFRTEQKEALEGLFTSVLELCAEAGLVKLGRVALDGRRVAGNATLSGNRTREALQEEVQRLLEEAARVDAEEDAEHGAQVRGDELPDGLRNPKERLKRLEEALKELDKKEKELRQAQADRITARQEEERRLGKKKRGAWPAPPETVHLPEDAKANATDPESRPLKTRRGWVQGYNAQAMAECTSQVIVAQQVTNEQNDAHQMAQMLEVCEKQAGRRPDEVLADSGYWTEAVGALDGEKGTELFVATAERAGEVHPQRDRMNEKLESERGQKAYAQRISTIEPVFGQMAMRGLNQFVLRGKAKVGLEWSLWCTTHNLLKLWRAALRARVSVPGTQPVAMAA